MPRICTAEDGERMDERRVWGAVGEGGTGGGAD